MGVQSESWLPKLKSREQWYSEHFILGIKLENLVKDGHLTKYDTYLLSLWSIYYYYDHDYNILPKAKDGGLNFGLIQSMRAIDQYKRDGDEAKKPEDSDNNDDPPIDI